MKKNRVILGSSKDLHVGIHLPLVEHPPKGWDYRTSIARHYFLFRRGLKLNTQLSPYRYPHFGEYLDFGPGDEIVHSSHYPVLNRRTWVADTDNLCSILILGRYAWHPRCHNTFRSSWSAAFTRDVRLRVKMMLAAYAHPSCGGILFFTEEDAALAKNWIRILGLNAAAKSVFPKFRIAPPSQTPIPMASLKKKWRRSERPRVLFCGRDFYGKNGDMALDIFFELAKKFKSARFDYVGFIPQNEAKKYRNPPPNVKIHPLIAHEKTLALFRNAHIFFHPSKTESLGMVFLEAAAAGTAIVTAEGKGMAHVKEFFDKQGAALLDRDTVPPERERSRFTELLEDLLANSDKARRMGVHNYELTSHGKLSRTMRHNRLIQIYEEALSRKRDEPLILEDIRKIDEETVPFFMYSDDMTADWASYKDEIGFKDLKNLLL